MRCRFPSTWTVEALDGGFKVVDANGQILAYVYGHADQRDAVLKSRLPAILLKRKPSCVRSRVSFFASALAN